ncbi:recombinase family protein [Synechococcus sp. CS-205]|uniref:recombinase family protein n=1 Tax=Synechococcus sp. CS-205 TaxID=2847984 RepID=UPI00223BFD5B|nr:recombinase family protein [Synechococcus sp. CS-205]MCT0249764.1 recombinase family protein [Synechococcus sp. CS-205]
MTRRPFAYLRVSTDDTHQDTSLERQLCSAVRCGVAEPDVLVERESGRNSARPQWQRLQELIRAGEVSTLWSDRSDRLGRDLFEVRSFYATCARSRTEWKFWSEPWLNSDAPEAAEIRDRAAYDAECESRRIGSRVRRHYEHVRSLGVPVARRAPLGLQLEGRGEAKHYILDTRPLAGSVTVADAARRLIDDYLAAGTIYAALLRWRAWLQGLKPIHEAKAYAAAMAFSPDGAGDWLELCAAELAGHVTLRRRAVLPAEMGQKPKTRRMNWPEWELARDRHEALIEPITARKVLHQLAENSNKGRARATATEARSDGAIFPSFSRLCVCGACGSSVTVQGSRDPRTPGRPPHRSLRCRNSSAIRRRCNEPSIAERKLIYQLMPVLVAESQRVSQLMTGGAPMLTTAALDPALVAQLEQARALAAATGLPEMRSAVLALESKVADATAVVREAAAVDERRKAAAQRLAHMLPSIGPDLHTMPAVRRSVMGAIERIEVKGGKVVGVTLASG